MPINQTEYNLKGLSGGEFGQLMSKLLPRIDNRYEGLISSGQVEGTSQTRKGTPDIWLKKEIDSLICFEITNDTRKEKLESDLDKCIPFYKDIRDKEYVCVLNYEPQLPNINPIEQKCFVSKIKFVLISNNRIAKELDKSLNHDLRQDYLNITANPISLMQYLSTESGATLYDYSNELKEARTLVTQFKAREAIERAYASQRLTTG